jgi:predicted HicB family RNase H-like nuclease
MMEFKGYIGKVEFDDDAEIFHGEIINTRDVITFQGRSVAELTKAFRDSVDDYLEFCKQRGEAPEKPFSGQFVTRIPPELHRLVNVAAAHSGKSLNAWVTEQLQNAVQHVIATKTAGQKAAARPKAVKKVAKRRKSIEQRA